MHLDTEELTQGNVFLLKLKTGCLFLTEKNANKNKCGDKKI
jgi:hypothetical protein